MQFIVRYFHFWSVIKYIFNQFLIGLSTKKKYPISDQLFLLFLQIFQMKYSSKAGKCANSHLFPVSAPRRIEQLNEISRVSKQQNEAYRASDHADHSQPHVSQSFWWKYSVSYGQHVGHRFEQCIRILLPPISMLGFEKIQNTNHKLYVPH